MWLKYVDPEEAEGEHYEVYEQELKKIQSMAHLTDEGNSMDELISIAVAARAAARKLAL